MLGFKSSLHDKLHSIRDYVFERDIIKSRSQHCLHHFLAKAAWISMWRALNSFWYLLILLNYKSAGYYYQRLKSYEGRNRKPRLNKKLYNKYCKEFTPCRNIKDCTKPKDRCIEDGDCGDICFNPSSRCSNGWCQNGGQCSVVNGTVHCSCPSNFTGKRCSIDVDECTTLPQPCKNGATCTNVHGGYFCRCITGWDGSDCSININDCVETPDNPKCLNGGTCVDRVGSFRCNCPPNKAGLICQFDNECASNPCNGNSTCNPSPFGKAKCICSHGWSGPNCDVDIPDCNVPQSPCYHGGTCRDVPGSFVCDCVSGFSGTRCEKDINECDSNPCQNGNCLDYYNKFECICHNGWTGTLCETEINECDSSPCQNGGQCYNKLGEYSCTCLYGYEGTDCEINIDDCASSPCKNAGTCQDLVGEYSCICPTGFTGTNCETNVNECASSPCQNMGTCVDAVNGYTCHCRGGYTGKNCEHEVDECQSSPCQSGGTCRNLVNGYLCICPPGTSGYHCESDPDDCPVGACKNGGICIDGMNNYSCKCHPGFTSSNCAVEIDECATAPCRNGGQCIDEVAQYKCQCPNGYTGRDCEIVIDGCLGHSCRNGASCSSTSAYTYTCSCKAGYSGQYCEEDINECQTRPCFSGTCVDGVNGYTCRCNPGFTGDRCVIDIDDCQSRPCVQGGTCIDGINQYVCSCPRGFAGKRCEIHINECSSNPCKNGGTCTDRIGSYSCYCPPGYTGADCQQPVNRCQNNPCRNGGTCQRTGRDLSDFRCVCPVNYQGTICDVRMISCALAKSKGTVCLNQGTCVDDMNSIQSCTCKPGFTGSYCEKNINDCASGPCKYGATCHDRIGNYTCTCTNGFTGRNCDVNINDCASNPCQRGTCIDLIDGVLCSCPKGYVGPRCETNPNDCFLNACFNGGTCRDGIASYQCSCLPGYTGTRCEVNIDECASNPCSGLGTEKCFNLVDNYHCQCKRGFLGKHCQLNINECLSFPCQNGGTCKDGAGKYTCLCKKGFSGENCERQVYSCSDTPCENSGTCHNVQGSYKCSCKRGVYGEQCEWNKDDCLSDPCKNGGTCVDGYDSYTCKCQTGFAGRNCEQMVNECASQPCRNGGSCRDMVGGYKCDCPEKLIGKNCEVLAKDVCPYSDCAKKFDGGRCVAKCNNYECNWDGTTCSLGIEPWSNCTTVTSSGRPCYEVFANGKCNKECNTGTCLMDGFDCRKPIPSCPHNRYCAPRFADTRCDKECNNKGCLEDGLDCNIHVPKTLKGTLVLVLLVTPEVFMNGSREFVRELSRVLGTIAFIKKDKDDRPMVLPFPLPPSAPVPIGRYRRSIVDSVWYMEVEPVRKGRSRRSSSQRNGAEVHISLDNRGCTSSCFQEVDNAAKFLGAKASVNKLNLPYPVYAVNSEKGPEPAKEHPFEPSPLWIAILCVGIPLFIVGVLAGGKRMYTKLWVPEGFPRRLIHQRRSQRRDPVGQEVSMRSMNKSSSNLEEEGAAGGTALPRSDLTPPSEARDPKRVKIDDEGDVKIGGAVEKDTRKWTRLHREAADVNVRSCSLLRSLQECERGSEALDVDARGPGGFTALHLASCRGTFLDGCIDDDKESDDSGGIMVSDLLSFGASYGAKTDESKETPLHLAARHSRADAAKRLLDAGADPNSRDRLGRTPLHLAVGSDAQGVFQILLRTRATDLEARMDDGTTPLILAARFDLVDIVKDLIKAGTKVNNIDNQGKSALHWAAAVNSHEVTAELTKNGAKKDLQDDKGQTPLFLGAREGSLEAVRILLLNYANRNIADNMDKTPEHIARQKMHQDIVQLLTDWSLGCNSPKAAPAPTSPPDQQKSPHHNGTNSPPCTEQMQNGKSAIANFPVMSSTKTKVSSSSDNTRGARAKTTVNGLPKRKRKRQPRKNDENHFDNNIDSRKPSDGGAATAAYSPQEQIKQPSPCSSGATFSPNCVSSSVMNGFSPQGSSGTGISPSNSTTLSPPQDTNSPPVFSDSPFDEVLGSDYCLEGFNVNGLDFDINLSDPELTSDFGECGVDGSPNLHDSLSIPCMLPVTTIGDETVNTSDCMFYPRQQRRDYPAETRLHSAQSSPNLPCTVESIVQDINDMNSVAHCVQSDFPNIHRATQACVMANNLVMNDPRRKNSSSSSYTPNHHHQQQLYHHLQHPNNILYNENYPTPPSVHSYTHFNDSPQKLPVSYLTPSPDSPEDWSSSPKSDYSSC